MRAWPQTRCPCKLVWRLSCVIAAASAASAAMPGAAQATPSKQPIPVFEVHFGPRAAEAERVLGPLRDALESHGFAARPESILKIAGGNAPRPGIMDLGVTAKVIAQRVDDGYLDYMQGNFETAIKALNEAIKLIQRNPALLAIDTGNSTLMVKALVGLASSHARLGHEPETMAAMDELVRMYPSVAVMSASFGPEAERLHHAAWKRSRALGRGRIAITAGHPQAVIFVDGQIRGLGTASLVDLIPGLYRVFIQIPGTIGRQYEVEVRPNEDHQLDLAWSVDSALIISDSWIGFELTSEDPRGREAQLAGALVERWQAGDRVVIIGLRRLPRPLMPQDKPVVIGTLYRTDGKVIRNAQVGLDGVNGSNGPRLIALAQFLADGTPAAGLEILDGEARPAAPPPAGPGPAPAPAREPAPGGRARWFIFGGAAACAAGLGLYLVDQDSVSMPGLPVQERYWNTAPYGIAFGAAGVVSIGVGLWWSYRTKSSSRPTFSAGVSHAELGWSGRF
ncbi:MAG TPA: hypothetical protein VNO30_50725 [Kofleriaceae bacterium]|nr:hypothetical protein [Kofleriaceae bacterium]